MHEPIKMVVVSLLNVAILTIVLLFYRYVYPKKTIPLLPLLVFIAILPLVSMLRPGSYESGDLSEHIKLSMMFFNELSQGHIIPSWTDLGCSGYGCPIFSFIYPLPYYLISFLHSFGLSFVASVKLFLAVSFIASGVTMYLWMKEEFGEKAGFIAGVFYLFAPYHLVDLHFRNAIGEMAAFALLPLCFLFTKKVLTEKNKKWILFNAITLSLLILSHFTAAFVTLPLLFLYSIVFLSHKRKKWPKTKMLGLSFLLSFLFTCFYWLPVAFEGKFIYWGIRGSVSFYPIHDLLFSPWRYGFLFQGPYGEHSHLVGYIHLVIVFIAGFFLLKNKIRGKSSKKLAWFFFITFLLSFIMILPITKIIWEIIPFMNGFQFSYRLLIFNALSSAVLAAIMIKKIKNKKIIIILCIVTIGVTILNWGNRKAVPSINDTVLQNQAFNKDIVASPMAGPIWTNNNPQYWQKRITQNDKLEIISGNASIKIISFFSTKREYLIQVQTKTRFRENTFYYPGWNISVNNKPIAPDIQDKQYPGILVFELNKGVYKVTTEFSDTKVRSISKYISLTTIIIILLLALGAIKRRFNDIIKG